MRRVTRCDCWRAKVGDSLMTAARIPGRYQRCDLAQFQAYNDKLKQALGHAQRLGRRVSGRRPGPVPARVRPGVGKTHLAVAVLRQVIRTKGARGVFYDTRELLKLIRSTYDPSNRTEERDVLRPVMEAELLVLDDLGAETDHRLGRRDAQPHRQHTLQRAADHDLHVELRPDSGRDRPAVAAVPGGRPDAVAPARDVRLPARRRRRLSRDAAQRHRAKTW